MTHLTSGRLLSSEESLRLAVVDSVERDKMIASIVARLRKAARPRNNKSWLAGTPRDWYRAQVTRGNRI